MPKSAITCTAWIRRGLAKEIPDKVVLSKEQLEEVLKKEKGDAHANLGSDEEEEMEEVAREGIDMEAIDEDNEDDDEDDLTEFDLENYDNEPVEGGEDNLANTLDQLAVFSTNQEDPYITLKESEEDSEHDDLRVDPTDNLIIVGRAEEDYSNLEIYVYNEDQDELYIHHDVMLNSSYPLALEWLDFDPGEDKPGNMVAVGSMTPTIEVWDLDIVDCVEPAFTLGVQQKKKKKGKALGKVLGHREAVLDLSWNRNVRNVLASCSADHTVLLWDLNTAKPLSTISSHSDRVQALEWHPFEVQSLLSGGFDRQVHLHDCRTAGQSQSSWQLDGEVERLLWNHFSPFHYLASLDDGCVLCMDVRQQRALFTLKAHEQAVTGLGLSSHVPGCLYTVSEDHHAKVWDIQNNQPTLVVSKDMKMGILHTVTCCPDAPYVLAIGGQKQGLRVWDVYSEKPVKEHFSGRDKLQIQIETDKKQALSEGSDAKAAVAVSKPQAKATEQPSTDVASKQERKKKKKKKINT